MVTRLQKVIEIYQSSGKTKIAAVVDGVLVKSEDNDKGIMAAIDIPDDVKQQILDLGIQWPIGSEPTPFEEMHITLAVFNKETVVDRDALDRITSEVCAGYNPISGRLNGVGRFFEVHKPGMNCIYLNFDCAGLSELRQELVSNYLQNGLEVLNNHGYSPHMTLAYIPENSDFDISKSFPVISFSVPGISVFWKNEEPVLYEFNTPAITKRMVLVKRIQKAEFEEDKHPRAKDGKFTSGAGGGGAAAAPKEKKPKTHGTENLTIRGMMSVFDARRGAYIQARGKIYDFISKNPDVMHNDELVAIDKELYAKYEKDPRSFYSELISRVRPAFRAAGKEKQLNAFQTAARIDADRKAHQARMRHGGEAPTWAQGGKPKPEPKPVAVKKPSDKGDKKPAPAPEWKPKLDPSDIFDADDKKVADGLFPGYARVAYLAAKKLIGKNDKLYAEAQRFLREGAKSKDDYNEHLENLLNIAREEYKGAEEDLDNLADQFVSNMHDAGFKFNMRRRQAHEEKLVSDAAKAPRGTVPEPPIPIHAKVPKPIREKLQLFRKAKITDIKPTGEGGANGDANDTITLEGDGRAIMKGISGKRGSEYGCPASEVCAYEMAAAIGFDKVFAPTAYRIDRGTKEKTAYPHSVQAFVEDALPGTSLYFKPRQTKELHESISMMIAFDYAMANRDRNPGNYMFDQKNGTMVAIDNGLVGLEAGRGVRHDGMRPDTVFSYCENNVRQYCSKLADKYPFELLQEEHVEAVRNFVHSPAFEENLLQHWKDGTPGGDDRDKFNVPLDEFISNYKAASEEGLARLDRMLARKKKAGVA